jgi:hypothetical protein
MVRQYGVWLALFLTLVACYWVTIQETVQETMQEDESMKNSKAQVTQKHNFEHASRPIDMRLPGHLNSDKLSLRAVDLSQPGNLFTSFVLVEDAAQIESQASSLATNPYTYAGKITENGDWTVFLTDGAKNFAVKTGDDLEGGWRVQRIQQTQLTLIYQPLKQEVILDIGATF